MRLPFHLFSVAAGFRASMGVRSANDEFDGETIGITQEGPNDMPGLERQCQCSDDGVVDGQDTGKAGCGLHFGRRIGYMCYIEGGDECDGAKKGRIGIYYRLCPTERKRDVARDRMYESMEGIDADLVAELMKQAEAAHVNKDALQAAEQRIEQIGEMLVVREKLEEALTGFDKKELLKLAKQADKLELYEFMDADIPEQIDERLEFLESKDDKEEKLNDAIDGIDLKKLQHAIKQAIEVRADDAIVQAGKKREAELIEERAEIKAALLEALDGWNKKELETLAEKADKHKLFSELAADIPSRIEARVDFLGSAGKKEANLRTAMEGVDLKRLQEAIRKVEDVRSNEDLVAKAKQREQELIAERKQAREQLDAALTEFDVEALEKALEEAKRLKIATREDKDIAKGRAKYLEIMADDSLGNLLKAIARSQAQGKYPDITEKAHVRVKELRMNMHKQKMKVKRMVTTCNDPDELEKELKEGLRIRAVGKELRTEAEERIAELREAQK